MTHEQDMINLKPWAELNIYPQTYIYVDALSCPTSEKISAYFQQNFERFHGSSCSLPCLMQFLCQEIVGEIVPPEIRNRVLDGTSLDALRPSMLK